MTAKLGSHKSLCIAFASSSRQEISLNANILPWTYFVNLRHTLFDSEFEIFWLGWTRDCLKMRYRWNWSSRLNDNVQWVPDVKWQGSILVLYKTNNECFSFVQWNKYFHLVKDEMFHSTRRSRVEWNISSFTSWKYLYHCTHKHSLFVYLFMS